MSRGSDPKFLYTSVELHNSNPPHSPNPRALSSPTYSLSPPLIPSPLRLSLPHRVTPLPPYRAAADPSLSLPGLRRGVAGGRGAAVAASGMGRRDRQRRVMRSGERQRDPAVTSRATAAAGPPRCTSLPPFLSPLLLLSPYPHLSLPPRRLPSASDRRGSAGRPDPAGQRDGSGGGGSGGGNGAA